MNNPTIRRISAMLLAAMFLLSGICVNTLAEDGAPESMEETTAPTEETTTPTEETTAPTEETMASTEEATAPTEETTAPTEETIPPTEETTAPTEETTAPTGETTISTEEATISTEETQPSTEAASEPTEPAIPRILPIAEDLEAEENLYFGQLHAHSSPVSGAGTITDLFRRASQTAGLDFFAITDHSDSFDGAASGSLADNTSSQYWAAGKAAARAVTSANFVGIYGFEMSWPERMQLGHIGTFNTPGFQSWTQEAYSTQSTALKNYYDTLAAQTGAIGQWNHPGNQYGTFSDFDHYSPGADRVIHLLEVEGAEDLASPSGYQNGYWCYNQALDAGWHVAPTNNGETGRTVILSQTLTEAALYEAIQNHRVYATADCDLEIVYTMDGFAMGSRLKTRHVGTSADILVDLYDPTDSAIGQVEVIVDGGTVAARHTLAGSCDLLSFSLSPTYSYYYLRITQSDGDIAVTAPIWIEAGEDLGISGFVCETAIPVQHGEITMALELYNRESADFLIDTIEIFADGVLIAEDTSLAEVPSGETLTHDLCFCFDGIGQTEIRVQVSGTLEGYARTYTQTLPLSFRQSQQVTDIVIDGSHGNTGLDTLTTWKAMAASEDIRVVTASSHNHRELLQDCRFLLVTAPTQSFSSEFLDAAAEYVYCGGSILLCGQAQGKDAAVSSAEELNRLLTAIGSTIRLNRDTLTNTIYHGSTDTQLFPETIHRDGPWCSGILTGQNYCHADGCSVSPGQGTALVTCRPTTVSSAGISPAAALCWEETPSGGTVLVAGSLFLGDGELKAPVNLWALPYANCTIAGNLLGIGGEVLPLSPVSLARKGDAGTLLRIRGYVTAGTANHWNSFPRTLYVQDDTGGIGVIPFEGQGIAVGTPVEITGVTEIQSGNRILKPISWKTLDASFYRYLPETGGWKDLLDPELHGGQLVEVEGECTEVILAEDGYVSRIVLKDSSGNAAHILVEDYIFSGATGKNELHEQIKKGRTVRAMGILHVEETGDVVIRVRNCEEVVYVPPRKLYINPKTGDWLKSVLQ